MSRPDVAYVIAAIAFAALVVYGAVNVMPEPTVGPEPRVTYCRPCPCAETPGPFISEPVR